MSMKHRKDFGKIAARGARAALCLLLTAVLFAVPVFAASEADSATVPFYFTPIGMAAILFVAAMCIVGIVAWIRSCARRSKDITPTVIPLEPKLPELVTSVAAARRGNSDIAIGNIVGSNLFNIMFVVGITAVIVPVVYQPTFRVDSIVAVAAAVLLLVCVYRGRVLKRRHGLLMLACYGGYFAYLLLA